MSEFKPDLKMSFWICDWIVRPNKKGKNFFTCSVGNSLIDNVCFEWMNKKTIGPACHVRKNAYASFRH